jgi:hypothetical protein
VLKCAGPAVPNVDKLGGNCLPAKTLGTIPHRYASN